MWMHLWEVRPSVPSEGNMKRVTKIICTYVLAIIVCFNKESFGPSCGMKRIREKKETMDNVFRNQTHVFRDKAYLSWGDLFLIKM